MRNACNMYNVYYEILINHDNFIGLLFQLVCLFSLSLFCALEFTNLYLYYSICIYITVLLVICIYITVLLISNTVIAILQTLKNYLKLPLILHLYAS